jgi:phosphinothricin acetyltransferase
MQTPAPASADDALTVRDARAGDLARIVEIYNAVIPGRRVTADLEPVSVESRRPWFEAHEPHRRPLWVLERASSAGPVVLGWLSLSDFYGRAAYSATAEVSIYLAQEAQGLGHGRRLLERIIEFAPRVGVSTLVGFIFGHNTPSLELFKRLRFETWGMLPRVARLDEDERDLVIVGRRLY